MPTGQSVTWRDVPATLESSADSTATHGPAGCTPAPAVTTDLADRAVSLAPNDWAVPLSPTASAVPPAPNGSTGSSGLIVPAISSISPGSPSRRATAAQAVLFDIDGTLLNSEKTAIQSLQRLLREETGQEYPHDQLLAYFGHTSLDTLRALQLPSPEKLVVRWEAYYRQAASSMQFFPGIAPLLVELRRRRLRLGVVTSKNRAELAFDLERFPELAAMDVHVCSEDVARPKPAPDALVLALHRLAISPAAAIYVGDTFFDQQAARAARVPFALAGWGARQTRDLNPDFWLRQPADLLQVLRLNQA